MKNHPLLLFVAFLYSIPAISATYPSQYDIVYHRISITVNPTVSGAPISNGSVTTYFKTTAPNLDQIGFDFRSNMTVSSVTYHGVPVVYTFTLNKIILTFPSAIAVLGTLDSVTIQYSGTPAAPVTSVPSGYNSSTTNKAIYTLGEAYSGSSWWPCKDSLTDKIDSVDMIITTPSAYRAAGNGLVTEQVVGPNRICTWKTRYRIATYMVNFAVADYTNYQYSVTAGGVPMPVMNYLYTSSHNNATYKGYVDVIKNILPKYETVLNSEYPFKNEKYGIADCYGNWGALEVQTMTFTSSFNDYTLAHELAHQWFADKVTTNDWHHIWLNEGFAQYFESVIYPEQLKTPAQAATQRSTLKGSVSNTSTTYVSDISTVDKIFIGSGTQPYQKGAMILSMLRSWLGDTKFFNALHNYLNAPGIAYDFTSVDSLKKYMQAQVQSLGFDLTNFFNDWVYKKGRVTYAVKYQYVTNGVYIQLTQSPTSGGAGYFDMPVPLRIQNGSGLDTTIVVIDRRGVLYNSATGGTKNTNVMFYKLSATPTIAPVLDPNNVVLAASSSITSSSTLSPLIILPIQHINFTAIADKQKVNLDYKIETDELLQSVIIEKSLDGTDFAQLVSYKPEFSLNHVYEESTTDDLLNTIQYYRLKIVLESGEFVYSAVKRVVKVRENNSILVSPNPATNELNISMPPEFNSGQVKLLISDISGHIVKEALVAASVNLVIPVRSLSPGMYHILFVNKRNEQVSSRFIKQ